MRDGQIERLLGGYATNTLTEPERQALFEAALEDQDLFNALQDEQSLRELLDDSASRAMIEQVLNESRPAPTRGWFARPWAWGLAGCVAAGLVLAFVLGPFGQTARPRQDIAVLKAPSIVEQPAPASDAGGTKSSAPGAAATSSKTLKRQSAPDLAQRKSAQATPSAAVQPPAPPAAPPSRDIAALPMHARPQDQLLSVSPAAGLAGFQAGGAAFRMEALPYSFVRRGPDGSFAPWPKGEAVQPGDAVRVVIRPRESGTLAIFEQSPEGNWKNIQDLPVSAAQEYTVPESPIQVSGATRLRLVMTPGEIAPPGELQESAKEALRKPKARLQSQSSAVGQPAGTRAPPQPLVTEITLTPGKPPGQ